MIGAVGTGGGRVETRDNGETGGRGYVDRGRGARGGGRKRKKRVGKERGEPRAPSSSSSSSTQACLARRRSSDPLGVGLELNRWRRGLVESAGQVVVVVGLVGVRRGRESLSSTIPPRRSIEIERGYRSRSAGF